MKADEDDVTTGTAELLSPSVVEEVESRVLVVETSHSPLMPSHFPSASTPPIKILSAAV